MIFDPIAGLSNTNWLHQLEQRVSGYLKLLRTHVDVQHGNIAAIAFGEVQYHLRVLERVLERYSDLNAQYVDTQESLLDSTWGDGGRTFTEEEAEWFERGQMLQEEVRQEIETFYLFARILLDKMTQAFVACIGQGEHGQTSHRRFIAAIDDYLTAKGLPPAPDELRELMQELESTVIDFRDDVVVHDKSARGMRPLGWNKDARQTFMHYSRLYPRETDPQIVGLPPPEAMETVRTYVERSMDYLGASSG